MRFVSASFATRIGFLPPLKRSEPRSPRPPEGLVETPQTCTFIGAALDSARTSTRSAGSAGKSGRFFITNVLKALALERRRPSAGLRRSKAEFHPGGRDRRPGSRRPPFLEQASIVVVPLRIARGIQRQGSRSDGDGQGRGGLSPGSRGVPPGLERPRPFGLNRGECGRSNLLALFDDAEERRRLGEAGRSFVSTHRRWDHCLEPLTEILGAFGRPSRRDRPSRFRRVSAPYENPSCGSRDDARNGEAHAAFRIALIEPY